MKPVALIDMDGTVADYDGAMKDYLELIKNPNEPDAPEDSPFMEARRRLIGLLPGFWLGLKKIPLGFKVLELLSKFDLMVLTKGPRTKPRAWSEKRKWCHKHLPRIPVTITEEKGLVYGKVLFDDWPPYVLSWLEWRTRGFVIMLENERNKDFNHPQVFKIRSNEDLPELKEKLEEIYEQCISTK